MGRWRIFRFSISSAWMDSLVVPHTCTLEDPTVRRRRRFDGLRRSLRPPTRARPRPLLSAAAALATCLLPVF